MKAWSNAYSKNLQEYQVVSPAELKSAYPALSPLFDPQGYLRTRPDLHAMDGFFAAMIVRKNQC